MSAVADLKLPEPAPDLMGSEAPFAKITRESKAWKMWLLWVSDACTVFFRGVCAGLFPGVGGAGLLIAQTDTTEASTVLQNGLLGFAGGLVVKGLERFHNWQQQPDHEMPNPFRTKGTP